MTHRSMLLVFASVLLVGACGRADAGPNRTDETASTAEAAEQVAEVSPNTAGASDPAAELIQPAEDAGALDAPRPAVERPAGAVGEAAAPAASASASDQPTGTQSPDEILRRAEQVYADMRTMQADFVQNLTVPLLNSTQRSEGTMYQKRPDRFLMRFSDPEGDIIVADGQHFWMYQPSVDRTQVFRSRMTDGAVPMDFQREFISNPTRRYVATLAGSEAVQGRDTHLISLVPRGSSPYRLIRIWVDKEDHLIRRFEMTEENDSVRRIELRNLRRNLDLADSLFRFEPPAGTQVFDQ